MTCVIQQQQLPGLVAVSISGLIDENFPVNELLTQLTGDGVINLAMVTGCSTFGIRPWQSALRELQSRPRHWMLVECSPAVVGQLNAVRDFTAGIHVKSVQLPYACDACATNTVVTVDVDAQRDALLRGEFPRPRCSLCAISMRFDDLAEDYFAFLRRAQPPPPGSALADFIARFESATAGSTQARPDPREETDFGQLGVGEERPTSPGEPMPALLAKAGRPPDGSLAAPSTLAAALAGQPRELMTPFEEDVSQLASAYVDNGTTAPGMPSPDVLALAGVAGSPEPAAAIPAETFGPRVEMVPFVTADVTTLVGRPPGIGLPPRRSAPVPPIAHPRTLDWAAPSVRLGLAAGVVVILGLGFALARVTGPPPVPAVSVVSTPSTPPPVSLREATALEIVELNALLARDRFDDAEALVRGVSGQLEESSRQRLSEIIARDRQNAVEGHRTRALAASADLQDREALSELKQAIALGKPTEELLFLLVKFSGDARDCRGLRVAADEFERTFPASTQTERVTQLRANCREGPLTAPPRASPSAAPSKAVTQAEIVEVAVGSRTTLVECIQKHLATSTGKHGKLDMEWTVLPSGKVSGVRCNTPELRNSPLAACITALISTWAFSSAPNRKSQQVQFPFKF